SSVIRAAGLRRGARGPCSASRGCSANLLHERLTPNSRKPQNWSFLREKIRRVLRVRRRSSAQTAELVFSQREKIRRVLRVRRRSSAQPAKLAFSQREKIRRVLRVRRRSSAQTEKLVFSQREKIRRVLRVRRRSSVIRAAGLRRGARGPCSRIPTTRRR